jgi:hypothetical protein
METCRFRLVLPSSTGAKSMLLLAANNRKRIVLRLTRACGCFLVRPDVAVSPSRPSSQREHRAERRSMIAKATATRAPPASLTAASTVRKFGVQIGSEIRSPDNGKILSKKIVRPIVSCALLSFARILHRALTYPTASVDSKSRRSQSSDPGVLVGVECPCGMVKRMVTFKLPELRRPWRP